MGKIRHGSSKDVETLWEGGSPAKNRFHFREDVSVFDLGPIPGGFPGLGRPRCAIAGELFRCMNQSGFVTHYLSHDISRATMDVMLLDIPDRLINSGPRSVGRILGLEFLDRRFVTPKVAERVAKGELGIVRIEKLLQGALCSGTAISPAFVECSTKFEDADRYISDEEAATLGCNKLSVERLQSIYEDIRKISDFQDTLFRSAGFERPDGKTEGAIRYSDGTFIIVDAYSPDEMRLIGDDGLRYDKDPVREWFEINHPDWYRAVQIAKKAYPDDKSQWPQYSDLDRLPPDDFRQELVRRYEVVAEAIGAI